MMDGMSLAIQTHVSAVRIHYFFILAIIPLGGGNPLIHSAHVEHNPTNHNGLYKIHPFVTLMNFTSKETL
jgi:hypothetical protein